jgi:hypothetical protein
MNNIEKISILELLFEDISQQLQIEKEKEIPSMERIEALNIQLANIAAQVMAMKKISFKKLS